MLFEDAAAEFVILVIPEHQYEGLAVTLANLCHLVDPNIDETELYDEFLDMIQECEGEVTLGDVYACVAMAKATRFDSKFDLWQ